MGRVKITVNVSSVPSDPRSPFVTSGLGVGSPAITSRGFKEAQATVVAGWICDVLDGLENGTSEAAEAAVKAKVVDLCEQFPVYK